MVQRQRAPALELPQGCSHLHRNVHPSWPALCWAQRPHLVPGTKAIVTPVRCVWGCLACDSGGFVLHPSSAALVLFPRGLESTRRAPAAA